MEYEGNVRFYIASKTRYYQKWRALREAGVVIIASWLDSVEGEEDNTEEDWDHTSKLCLKEASEADVLLLYAEHGDILRGAYMEAGAALLCQKKVGVIIPEDFKTTEILLPHSLVRTFKTVEDAVHYYEEERLKEEEETFTEPQVRRLLPVSPRIESGPLCFGDDGPGLFLRGDEAFYMARQLDVSLEALSRHVSPLNPADIAYRFLQDIRDTIDQRVRVGEPKP